MVGEAKETDVAAHYSHGHLLRAFEEVIEELGMKVESLSAFDLAPLDEFHIGGLEATEALMERLSIAPGSSWLDVGAGVGGPARVIAAATGCRVSAVDLVPEFIEVARILTSRVGLAEKVAFHCGSALTLPFDPESFDGAYMLHVGMNIKDKAALFDEVARVLKPGAVLAVYDVMRRGKGEHEERDVLYPVPWASHPDSSFVASAEDYRSALQGAGFSIESERDRHGFAIDFFERTQAKARTEGAGKLAAHVVMGDSAPLKIGNLKANLVAGLLGPVEILARKAL